MPSVVIIRLKQKLVNDLERKSGLNTEFNLNYILLRNKTKPISKIENYRSKNLSKFSFNETE